ncbi:hypothetical protein LCGC14_0203990 [marine sediment metagenome]|uniref:Major facilitator superfamily (MFS) profile domain-containing protein n=1 Tax=marine sediment metagenome TaxID=412755 RepID=A0A0F9X259_9ZZZZ|nr:MFS transporter [Phycisphaerae bacterium]HDZ43458.1 MFS transporter [Phycisphaerae bacterium]
MLRRFCLYGFLKNQQYYDPFLWLALLAKGLSLTEVGLLMGFRAICVNVLEVPTGAAADVLGRRRSMVISMLAYIGSFAVFGSTQTLWALFAATGLFAVGEALRTGTHKAIIFDWLARQGRTDERTTVYGLTRSWSKLGSALSAVIAGVLVFGFENYDVVFWGCLIPYGLNVINLATYPAYLDGPRRSGAGIGQILRTLLAAVSASWRRRPLRRLLVESMGFEGLFRTTKGYIQPVLQAAVVALPVATFLSGRRRTAILIAAAAVAVNLLSSLASRNAGALTRRLGGERAASRWLWTVDFGCFALLAIGILLSWPILMIVAFVLLAIAQNFWRPILISQCASQADPDQTATILSIESQAKSLFIAIFAPLTGWAVDTMTPIVKGSNTMTEWWRFLPIVVLGLIIPLGMLATGRRRAYDRGAPAEGPGD